MDNNNLNDSFQQAAVPNADENYQLNTENSQQYYYNTAPQTARTKKKPKKKKKKNIFLTVLKKFFMVIATTLLSLFLVVVITMKSKKMEEKHGQILKLFSGCLMVILSLVMIFKPALMNDLKSTLIIFGGALAITLLILLVTTKILPKYGIYIGHMKENKKNEK